MNNLLNINTNMYYKFGLHIGPNWAVCLHWEHCYGCRLPDGTYGIASYFTLASQFGVTEKPNCELLMRNIMAPN
ncbi:hypothetical protein BLOT_011283 [Blomia tropicalis]|nr:hypothetical protein BLOT_011283 [Blomia tropicalis]